jgi:Periplasmic protein involved in polysaccharide export
VRQREGGGPMKKKIIMVKLLLLFCILNLLALSGCVKRGSMADSTAAADQKETSISKSDFVKAFTPPQVLAIKQKASGRSPMLYPGDEISIGIYDKLPVSQDARLERKRINDDGSIFILPARDIFVGGLTVAEAQKEIENKLSQFIVSPFCEIELTKRAFTPKAYVYGEVGKSGVVDLKEGDRLLDALSSAGGCASSAYRRSIKIIRVREQDVTMISINLYDILNDGKMDRNVILQDQDVVFVPRRLFTNVMEFFSLLTQVVPWYYFVKNF